MLAPSPCGGGASCFIFMLSITGTLTVFILLGISSLALFAAKRIGLPHTVLLVLIGVVMGFMTYLPFFGFLDDFHLTPELLFYLLLPTLIFESAYNMNIRRLVEDRGIILLLSIGSLLVSTALIGAALHYLLLLIGLSVPLAVTLLFGALISATDPVAVLALFKEYGAPRRLSLIFEGESLFNDATAVALFLILLGVATEGYHGIATLLEGGIDFLVVLIGGVLFGLFMGGIFSKVIGMTRENETASITLTIVLAHVTFILADIISGSLTFFGHHIHISAIIATTVASLVVGNYGRAKIHPRAEEFVEKLWGQLAFLANSIIFILVGLLFVAIPLTVTAVYLPILIAVLVVGAARAISIYPIVGLFNRFTRATPLPRSWQHLLSWGSLRGALAVTMVLLIPPTFSIPGWTIATVTPRDFILSLTLGCIFATLFIKATTIRSMMRRLKLDAMNEIEHVEYQEACALVHHEVAERLTRYQARGYLSAETAEYLLAQHRRSFQDACRQASKLTVERQNDLADRVLRMFAIGIEKRHLKELYHYEEVSEAVYRRITGKLTLQFEAIERGNLAPDMSVHTDSKDVFERLASTIRRYFHTIDETETIENTYMYYRAQTIIARKVLKELSALERSKAESIFTQEALQEVTALYERYRNGSAEKMEAVAAAHPKTTGMLSKRLAHSGVHKIGDNVLESLYERELITPKLYIALRDELAR